MAQFAVIAYDGTDSAAAERRRAARPAHLESVKPMAERGEIVFGAAILDDFGQMIGQAIFVEFPSRRELDAWLAREPFVRQGVWQKIEVKPVRIVVANGRGPFSNGARIG